MVVKLCLIQKYICSKMDRKIHKDRVKVKRSCLVVADLAGFGERDMKWTEDRKTGKSGDSKWPLTTGPDIPPCFTLYQFEQQVKSYVHFFAGRQEFLKGISKKDSLLVRLLHRYLTQNSLVRLVACCSPAPQAALESERTFDFALCHWAHMSNVYNSCKPVRPRMFRDWTQAIQAAIKKETKNLDHLNSTIEKIK